MRLKTTLSALVLTAVALAAFADDTKKADHAVAKSPALEPFKQLVGNWTGKVVAGHESGQEIHAKYKVTSAGSAVVETLFPGTEHEMVTVIHQDGDDLALTHYCALGNQPHLKTKAKSDGNKFTFKFLGGSNMKSENDSHMHEVTYTLIDKDTLKSEWTHFDQGKATGTAVFEFKRDK
jgi:hypothetical protein